MINDGDFVELAQDCINICEVLRVGIEGKNIDELSNSVKRAIEDLKGCVHSICASSLPSRWSVSSTVDEIEREIKAHIKRNFVSGMWHARYDREKIQGWKQEILKILGTFNVRRIMVYRFRC